MIASCSAITIASAITIEKSSLPVSISWHAGLLLYKAMLSWPLAPVLPFSNRYLHLHCRYCSDCWTPNNLNFKRNPAGKPELCWAEGTPDAPQPLHFNLSHTSTAMGEAAAILLVTFLPVAPTNKHAGWLTELPVMPAGIVIGANRLVGLDVEESSRLTRQDPLKLARRRFASAEVAQLQGGQTIPSLLPGMLLLLS